MVQKENAQLYAEEQFAFSAVKGVEQNDPSVAGVKADIEAGNVVDFPDHYYPSGYEMCIRDRITGALEAAKEIAEGTYAQGYEVKEDKVDEKLLEEAVQTAKEADVAVIFAGLPDAFESEGYDRTHMRMPECQNLLISEIAKVQKHVVVVLHLSLIHISVACQ